MPDSEPQLSNTESPAHEHSDLRDFLALLGRHVGLIIIVTVATAGIAYVVSARQPKQYQTHATLVYSASSSAEDPARAVDTIVGVSSSSAVLKAVAEGEGITVSSLENALSVSGNQTADLITISATSGSPAQAARMANGVSRALVSYGAALQKKALETQIATLGRQLQALSGRTDPSSLAAASTLITQIAQARAQLVAAAPLSVVTPAPIPTTAASPHPKRDALIGVFVGLALAVLLVVLRDRLDRRVRGIEEVESIYRTPTLGVVPFTRGWRRTDRSKVLANFSGPGRLADAYRTVRTNLTLLHPNGGDKAVVVLVTSAIAEEGKTTVAANLAHALSATGRRVLVVSADLHNPTLHEYFPEGNTLNDAEVVGALGERSGTLARWAPRRDQVGLVQVLAGEVSMHEAIRAVPVPEPEQATGGVLHVLADRTTFFDPAALLSSTSMQDFVRDAREEYDVIVLDTPPLLANADATLLAQEAGVLIVVARLDHVTKNQARRAVQVMASTRLKPTGLIVTGAVEEPIYGYRDGYDDRPSPNGSNGAHKST
jgi:Mrp family chromosome partitioning ATPase/capsular polysaccharide biosynthesis protein